MERAQGEQEVRHGSDPTKIVTTLRQWIVDAELPAGERVTELGMAERLGVSRTPVRLAFRALEQEGLLERHGKRGYEVRSFSRADVRAALEVRGMLEGLAVRHLAERGMDAPLRSVLLGCLADGELVLGVRELTAENLSRWTDLNRRFHNAILEAQDSRVIADALSRNNHLPLASADSIALDPLRLPDEHRKLQMAHWQHRRVFEAVECRDTARAENLMREHAWVGFDFLDLPVRDPPV